MEAPLQDIMTCFYQLHHQQQWVHVCCINVGGI